MKRCRRAINLILVLAAAAGCKTTDPETKKHKKEATEIYFYVEANGADRSHTMVATLFPDNPVRYYVENEPALTEGDIEEAAVMKTLGGSDIRVQFNRHGSWILENITTAYKGLHLAVYCKWGKARWIAAPIIRQRVTNGQFQFTPDATQEEAERIVRGLNNIAAALKKKESDF